MFRRRICLFLGLGAIGLTLNTGIQPTSAQNITFFCDIVDGVPTTMARTAQAQVRVISWNFPGLGASKDQFLKPEENK